MSKQNVNSILHFDESDRLGTTGEKIVADRYLQKGGELKEGALVVAVLDKKKSLHELAEVVAVTKNGEKNSVRIRLRDGQEMELAEDQMQVLKETAPRQMWKRIAGGLAEGDEKMEKDFTKLLENFKYIPGGRINASMGAVDKNGKKVETTSYNCFVIPNVGPTPKDYAAAFGRTLEIQARSGGVGMNMSHVPPQGTLTPTKDVRKSDVQLVMDVWHPDLREFLDTDYQNSQKVVRINAEFKQALEEDDYWTFEFPDTETEEYDEIWSGDLDDWKQRGLEVKQGDIVKALDLYERIVASGAGIVDGILFAKEVNPHDSRETIADALAQEWEILLEGKKAAVILSSLRPRYFQVLGVNGYSSGAYSWGTLYDKGNWAYAQGFGPIAVAEIMSTGCLLIIQG